MTTTPQTDAVRSGVVVTPQMEVEVPAMDGPWPDVTTMSQEETALLEPLPALATTSEARRMEGDASRVSLELVTMVQASASATLAPFIAEDIVPEEAL